MRREPLMLSDTAMILLRDYFNIQHDLMVIRQGIDQELKDRYSPGMGEIYAHHMMQLFSTRAGSSIREIGQMQDDLVREVQILWTSSDLEVTRRLEWHLRFDAGLMSYAERLFNTLPDNSAYGRQLRADFLIHLKAAYGTALILRQKGHDDARAIDAE